MNPDQLQTTADTLLAALQTVDPLTDYAEDGKQATRLGADMIASLAGALVRVKAEQRLQQKATESKSGLPSIAPAPVIPEKP